ncbi:MAG: two-component system, NtrC family, sensor kinase, partial [Actinomycetota bacterium]|nr:two-component system, NtrC family, sensor kinase [Actinomycetota bacterium]
HAQKLEAVGRLAGGIAHEINTPVQFVSDNLRFLEESFTDIMALVGTYRGVLDEAAAAAPAVRGVVEAAESDADFEFLSTEVPQALQQSRDGVTRVAEIVRSMKAFGHPDGKDQEPVDLNAAIADTLVVAASELKHVADVQVDYGTLPAVTCFRGDLNQVWLNLIVNAAHAIESAKREHGLVTVRTRFEGAEVVVEIGDSGTGIPQEVAQRIFDPFFTTKAVGKGTGQGLALARSVVIDRHHGSITFDTVDGEGTTFQIRLPVDGLGRTDPVAPVATAA